MSGQTFTTRGNLNSGADGKGPDQFSFLLLGAADDPSHGSNKNGLCILTKQAQVTGYVAPPRVNRVNNGRNCRWKAACNLDSTASGIGLPHIAY
jgi:hypothetical protein